MTTEAKLRDALQELMSIVSIHQSATGNKFAWAEMDLARAALSHPTAAEQPQAPEQGAIEVVAWLYRKANQAFTSEPPPSLKRQCEALCTASSRDFYKRRCDLLQWWQSKMRDPERTIVCDILANGQTLPPEHAGDRYATPPAPKLEPMTDERTVAKSVHEAVSAIYFADISDYLPALCAVVRLLSPDLAEMLEKDPRLAWQTSDDRANAHHGISTKGA
jgi:hypothetical protein